MPRCDPYKHPCLTVIACCAHSFSWFRFIEKEGHLHRCVWPLAERAALAMGIDEVRIDVFVVQGHPDDCQLNEISIS